MVYEQSFLDEHLPGLQERLQDALFVAGREDADWRACGVGPLSLHVSSKRRGSVYSKRRYDDTCDDLKSRRLQGVAMCEMVVLIIALLYAGARKFVTVSPTSDE